MRIGTMKLGKHLSMVLAALLLTFQESSGSNVFDTLNTLYENIKSVFDHFSAKAYFIGESWTDPIIASRTKYDFIIVGSGSAGSVIANRLSEISSWNILLLEAGKVENLLSRVPMAAALLQFTPYNWKYYMEYQDNMCNGLENKRMHWPRGRALGGTSVINYMIYTRGNRHDFDTWAAQGNPGWSYDDVLPYYLKSEKTRIEVGDLRYHGQNGSLSTENIYDSELVEAFLQSGKELNLTNYDYNANIGSFGLSRIQATTLRGERHSVARAFLYPIRKRKNLHVVTSAYVTKILIDPETREAYGVEYHSHGIKHTVHAKKEVILSAGAFNSPQLLMLAGIGPKDHLKELGIPLLQDLAVGHNLQDHLSFPGLVFLIDKPLSLTLSKLATPQSILGFLVNGTGPLTSLVGGQGIGYIRTEISQDPEDVPDIELLFVSGSVTTDYGLVTSRGMRITDKVYNSMFRPIQGKPTWSIFPMLLHPKSTGYLKLKSKNPFDYPLFYGNYFTDPEEHDIKTLVAAIRYIQKMANTTPFKKLNSRMNPNRMPDCDEYAFDSDDYWKCALRSIAVTLHHQVGTAKMGPKEDKGAVVDHELKVHGIKKLRVADCSVIPFALGAHTNAPSIMVGEKASDIIKMAWGVL